MRKGLLVFITTIVCTGLAYADGCLPGDPCYEKPMAKKVAPVAVPKREAAPTPVAAAPQVDSHFYTTVGAGWVFREKDEEILGHQAYEFKIGKYRFADQLSAEVGVAILPDVRRREFTSPGSFTLDDDTEGLRFSADLLYHFNEEASDVDPYLSIGGGVNTYQDDLEDGKSEWFAATGVGAFLNIDSCWFVKPDYRISVVDSDTEVNHFATVALGYRWNS